MDNFSTGFHGEIIEVSVQKICGYPEAYCRRQAVPVQEGGRLCPPCRQKVHRREAAQQAAVPGQVRVPEKGAQPVPQEIQVQKALQEVAVSVRLQETQKVQKVGRCPRIV
jgi:hypothetical protein